MTRQELNKILNKAMVHRQFFMNFKDSKDRDTFKEEWFRILEPYDYEDIDKNLEKFLMDENNIGLSPDVYQLIKRTLKSKDKKIKGRVYSRCMFCGKEFDYQFSDHEDRCRSIKYVNKLYQRYLKKDLPDRESLYKMSKVEFNKKYIQLLKLLLPRIRQNSNTEANGIENVIETYYGRNPKFTINEI